MTSRVKMDRENRAKQFMPFDALKGLREALAAKERIVVPKRDLSEEQKEELGRKLLQIRPQDIITAEYFHRGEYVQITGMVSRIDADGRMMRIVDTEIAFHDISSLQGEILKEL